MAPSPASSPARSPLRAARFAGLDGLRAVAVGLVLVYHLFPAALPGGFLGVDVFFAISGFLITSLLLREIDASGRIRLAAFWRRRARRLFPALGLVLLVCTAAALPIGGDLLVGVGGQIAGAALFVSNWVFIANGADYFARDTPELFRNTWSLSIEEQFYILLPLLLLALVRMRGRVTRAVPLLALALLSAVLMFELARAGAEPTRVYFGSDTHTFGLFGGAAMAMLLHRDGAAGRDGASARPGRGTQLLAACAVAAGGTVLAWLALTLPEGSPQSFAWGFQLATAASLALVWGATRPGAWIGSALDVRPLRWVGERSYGIYLWHWPLLLIFAAALPGTPAPLVPLLTLAATLLLAELSHRFVEQPVRRIGFIRSLRQLFSIREHSPRRRAVAAGLGAILLVTAPMSAIAVATAPAQSTASDAIARGQAALDAADADPGADATAGAPRAGGAERSEPAADAQGADGDEGGEPAGDDSGGGREAGNGAPEPLAPEGRDITAVGDSVMLASLPELQDALPGISVDAAVSRGMGAGIGVVSELSEQSALRSVLVVGLGTNGPVRAEELAEICRIAGDRPVVLVNAHADREWIPGVNEVLTSFADAHRGVVVADWTGSVSGVPDALAGDDIHPNPSGGEIYASAVQRALRELQTPEEAVGFATPRR